MKRNLNGSIWPADSKESMISDFQLRIEELRHLQLIFQQEEENWKIRKMELRDEITKIIHEINSLYILISGITNSATDSGMRN